MRTFSRRRSVMPRGKIVPWKMENFSVTSVLAELYPVKISPKETKKLIDKATK